MQMIFNEPGPVFEAANLAFNALFEGVNVANALSKARHDLINDYEVAPENAAYIVNLVKNTVFDPMAAPGAKPESDPTVKKYISLMPIIARYVAKEIIEMHFGEINENTRQRTAYLGEEIRKYLESTPNPNLDESKLFELDKAGAYNVTNTVPKDMGYKAIPVKSSAELNRKLVELGADEVPWCIRKEDPWRSYSNDGVNSFYILYNGSLPKTDPMSVIGTFVTPGGRVSSAFDRPNHAVNFEQTADLLASTGVKVATDHTLNSILKDGLYELENVVEKCDKITSDLYLVKNHHGDLSNIVAYYKGQYKAVIPDWVDSEKFAIIYDGNYPLFVTDGQNVYSLSEPYEKWCSIPDGLRVTGERASEDNAAIVYVKRDDRIVNILDIDYGELLLDAASDVPFDDSRFYSKWESSSGRRREHPSTRLTENSSWVLEYHTPRKREKYPDMRVSRDVQTEPDILYVVTEQGKNLADCPKVEIPVDWYVTYVSRNGKYCLIKRARGIPANDPDFNRYFLMVDGQVSQKSFEDIDDNGDGIWSLYPSLEKGSVYYDLNTETGEIEAKT